MRLYNKWSPCTVISVFAVSTLILFFFDVSFLHHGAVKEGIELVADASTPSEGPANAPIFSFWITGTGGEKEKILRLLKAVYHPRNRYLLHLDAGSTYSERTMLALSVRSEGTYRTFDNVDVLGKAYAVDKMGASAVSATLHGAAVLLRTSPDWDWFINLSASDYPLLTQDELLHVFSDLPRDLNFIHHTSNFAQEQKRFEDIVVDPNLHLTTSSRIVYGPKLRAMPNAFKIFRGSPRVILSRSFMEHCVLGLDNLPRKLLLYFSNVAIPMEAYFHTVICNSPEFMNTAISSDLGRLLWNACPTSDAVHLKQSSIREKDNSGAARSFMKKDTVPHDSVEDFSRTLTGSVHSNFVKPGENIASFVSELVGSRRKQACL